MRAKNKKLIEARRLYYKSWRKHNKDKIEKYNQRFFQKKLLESQSDNTTKKDGGL